MRKKLNTIEGEFKDKFMLHYNFPPYSVGETGFIGTKKKRDWSWKISMESN